MRIRVAILAFLLIYFASFFVLNCMADIIVYDNGAGGATGIDNAFTSDADIPAIQADDFVLSATEFVTSLTWTGAYAPDNTPPLTDDFTVSFFLDAGVTGPGALVSTFNVGDVDRTDSGADIFGFNVFEYTADFSGQSLNGGQNYWLSIANDTAGENDNWFWGVILNAGDSFGSVDGGSTWVTQGQQHDFRLLTVPEPALGSISLLLLCAVFTRRKR